MAKDLVLSVFRGEGMTITYTAGIFGDMSAWTAHSQVRNILGGDILADLTVGTGITINGSQSQLVWALTSAQTAVLPITTATIPAVVFDVFAEPPSGQPVRFGGGTITVLEAVTEPAIT